MLTARRTAARSRRSEAVSLPTPGGPSVLAALDRGMAMAELSADGRILSANANYRMLFGLSEGELLAGTSFGQTLPERERDVLPWAEAPAGQPLREERRRMAGTRGIWVSSWYFPVDGDGRVLELANDITVRRQRDAIHAAEIAAVLRTHAMIEMSPEGRVLMANEGFLSLFGYRMEEIQGKPYAIFVPDRAREREEAAGMWPALAAGRSLEMETRRLSKDGRVMLLRSWCHPIRDAHGTVVKVVEYAVDQTAERLAAHETAALEAAISKSQTMLEMSMDGRILRANEKFLEATGYTMDELAGRPHEMVLAEEGDRELWAELERGEGRAGEFLVRGKDGREVWLQGSYNAIAGIDDRPVKVVQCAIDVTAQKRIAADHAGQLAAINKSQAVVEMDLDGTIRWANENFLAISGYGLEELVGQRHQDLIDPEVAASEANRRFWERLRAGEHQAREVRTIGKGGRVVWLETSSNPVCDLHGRPVRVVTYATDTTRQVLAREETHGIVRRLAEASAALNGMSEQMGGDATRTAEQASLVSAASSQVNMCVEMVATSAEEMHASIQEIAKSATESARVATQAVRMAESANGSVAKLGQSSADIGNVIKVITSIAQQTNLLALNATIEAARAGDAGRGFAVVATEVKELARKTAQATEEISRKIETIQGDTHSAVGEIARICEIVGRINSISSTIASAVEEQTATTSEITRNASDAAVGTAEIAKNIATVAGAARSTTRGAEELQRSAAGLESMAGSLRQVMGHGEE